MRLFTIITVVCATVLLAMGCRGATSDKPPIHPNQNMDQQNRIDPQEPFAFFDDGRGMRTYVEGTVARGALQDDDHLYRGRNEDGSFALTLPPADHAGKEMKLDAAFLERGQQRYSIYCVPCHDGAGTGDGIVAQRGLNPKPPSFHDERVQSIPVGGLYDIVTNGVRNMAPYRNQLSVRDRWAVASYVRALQISRSSRLDRVPADKAASERWEVR